MTKLSRVATLAVALVVPASLADAATYDLKAQWNKTINPNGTWSVLQGDTPLPLVSDWTPLSTDDPAYNPPTGHLKQRAFAPGVETGNYLPAFFKAAVTPQDASFGWVKGELLMHTTDAHNGTQSGVARAIFTNPVAATATISGYVYNGRDIGLYQGWYLLVNGAVRASGGLPGDGTVTRTTRTTFRLKDVALAEADSVALLVQAEPVPGAPPAADAPYGDFIGFNLRIVTQ